MTKLWRPEGWNTLKAKNQPLHCFAPDVCVGEAYEAGADAMMKALKDRTEQAEEWQIQGNILGRDHHYGVHRYNQPFDAPPNTGTWVFIPDKDVEK